jgi:hypothetical protein
MLDSHIHYFITDYVLAFFHEDVCLHSNFIYLTMIVPFQSLSFSEAK